MKKVLIIVAAIVLLGAIVGFTVSQSRKNVIAVQTMKVKRADLTSIVSGSGEIRPLTYTNVGANAYGKIVKLYVKEGDRVKKGDLLAQIENVQPAADVAATRAAVNASETDALAAEAALKTAQADLKRAQSDRERAKLDYDRAEGLFEAQLIAKQDYDAKKAAFYSADSGLAQAQARIAQNKAQYEAARSRVRQSDAQLRRASDVLSKTTYVAPFSGVITNLPVREGESVVVGIQNQPGSTLMTVADMSVITAEVRIDEADIVNVKLGQEAEVSIDAIPKKTFKAKVTQIGDNAMIRSTGVATSQSNAASQEAKDFKVVVTLDEPPENLRPGLSCTAKITTATRKNVVSVPIQALTIRQQRDLVVAEKGKPAPKVDDSDPAMKKELQGVFVIHGNKADFVKVDTGIAGSTETEVVNGLKDGDQVVTGTYKVLRTLKTGSSVKIDNSTPKKEEESNS